jgi:hypothetical protein
MARTSVTARIDLSGPLFQRDPEKTINDNIRDMLRGVADEGERVAKAQLQPESQRVARATVGRVAAISGKPWHMNAVVSVSPDATHLDAQHAIQVMAIAAGRHKPITSAGRNIGTTQGIEPRKHIFRRLAYELRSARAILAANLTKGIE